MIYLIIQHNIIMVKKVFFQDYFYFKINNLLTTPLITDGSHACNKKIILGDGVVPKNKFHISFLKPIYGIFIKKLAFAHDLANDLF